MRLVISKVVVSKERVCVDSLGGTSESPVRSQHDLIW